MKKNNFYLFAILLVLIEFSLTSNNSVASQGCVPNSQDSLHSNTNKAFVGPIAKVIEPVETVITDIDESNYQEVVILPEAQHPRVKFFVKTRPTAEIADIDETSFKEVVFSVNEDLAKVNTIEISRNRNQNAEINYWETVHSIESKQGRLLFRPSNKARNCTYTLSPCGHHQLTVQALKDIGCKSLQCRKDRLDYDKSLAMSKKLLAKNEIRLKKSGYSNLDDYQKYLIHQQGATGIKTIIAANRGKKLLSVSMKKNMAGNSPYTYRQLRRMGSKLAAKTFLQHWKSKWNNEQQLLANNNVKQASVRSLSDQLDSYIDNHYDG